MRSDESKELEDLGEFCRAVWAALREFYGVDHSIWREEQRIADWATATGDISAMRAIAQEMKESLRDLPRDVRARLLAQTPPPKGNVNTARRLIETVLTRGRIANAREYAALRRVVATGAVEVEPADGTTLLRLLSEYGGGARKATETSHD